MGKYDTDATAKLTEYCPSCGAKNWRILKKQTISSGHLVYPYCCKSCGYRSALCEKRTTVLEWLAEKGLDTDALETHTNEANQLAF